MTTSEDEVRNPTSELESIKLVLLVLGVLLVISGQLLLSGSYHGGEWGPYSITGIGILAFIISVRSFINGKFSFLILNWLRRLSTSFGLHPYQLVLLLVAPIFSLVAWLASGDGLLMLQGTLAVTSWLFAITLFLLSHWTKPQINSSSWWERRDTWIVGILFVIALVARGFLLDDLPWLLTGDEASAGLTAVEFVQGERNNIFTTGWFSFPSLFFWTQSLSIRLLGQTALGLRFPSMLAGALTVPALYWSIKPFMGRALALGASAFLAVFHFHIHFSRIGLNNIWDGLFTVLFIGIIWRAWNEDNQQSTRTSFKFALAGIVLGLSQYFYTSVRIIAGIFIVFVILLYIQDRKTVRKKIPGLISTLLGFIVAMLPLAAHYIVHPDQFTAPFARVSHLGPWLSEEMNRTGQSAIQILANQFKLAALGFTHENIRNWYSPGKPMLLAIPSALFILGIVILLFRLRQPIYQWILLWLISAITISALSESTPAAQRLTFVAPGVAILVVLPLTSIRDWLLPVLPRRRSLIILGTSAILFASMVGDLSFYFGSYSQSQKFGDTNTEVAQGLADYLNTLGGSPTVYFCGLPRMGYYTHSSIRYLAPNAYGVDIPDPIQEAPTEIVDDTVLYVFLPERRTEIELIKSSYPEGQELDFTSRNNDLLFTIYLIENQGS